MNFFLASSALGVWMDTTFAGFDMAVFQFFGKMQNDILTGLAQVFTTLGEPWYVVLMGLLGIVLIFFKRTRKYGLALVFSIAIGTLLTNVVIKELFMRVRPYNTLQHIPEYFGWYQGAGMLGEGDYCFPSGHATAATEIALSLFLCFRKDKKGKWAWLLLVAAALNACSRVYLMVHYATDVICGILVGCLAAVIGYNLARLITEKQEARGKGDRLDLERIFCDKFHVKSTRAGRTCAVIIAWLAIFLVSFLHMNYSATHSPRCAYKGDYQCYNEAEADDKYLYNGDYYCEMHWQELNP